MGHQVMGVLHDARRDGWVLTLADVRAEDRDWEAMQERWKILAKMNTGMGILRPEQAVTFKDTKSASAAKDAGFWPKESIKVAPKEDCLRDPRAYMACNWVLWLTVPTVPLWLGLGHPWICWADMVVSFLVFLAASYFSEASVVPAVETPREGAEVYPSGKPLRRTVALTAYGWGKVRVGPLGNRLTS